ncbi:tRNA lysidine(34) synthetase TilS [Chloroflexota bacterium]
MVKEQGYQEPMEQRVLRFIRENHLESGQHWLLVAVSGGPDSVCLLHILDKLQHGLNMKLHVAHLNHLLRGAESEADAQYVSDLAHQLGIPATIERRDVRVYRAQQRTSLEEAAREVRYAFLAEVAKSTGADRVAVGHTTDDHVETILMNLIRGAGTRGLRGLQPSSRWQASGGSVTVIRPLLPVSRLETTGYCHKHQLMPRVDTSNLSLSLLRNRIRHQLLPLLQSYNPQVAEALLRTARIAGDTLTFLDGEGARLWDNIAQRQEGAITLNKKKFLKLPSAMKRYLLMGAIERLLGSLKDIEMRHVEEMMAALSKPAGKRFSLPRGLVFIIEYNKYVLSLDLVALSPLPTLRNEFILKIPGETLFPGWRVEATIMSSLLVQGKPEVASVSPGTATPLPSSRGEGMGVMNDKFTAQLDFNEVGAKVVVRYRQPGDRFQPLGMSGSKKLGEFMIDKKIPRAWRQRIPVVCSSKQILWVVGWRVDNRVKVTESTKMVLCLEFVRTINTYSEG